MPRTDSATPFAHSQAVLIALLTLCVMAALFVAGITLVLSSHQHERGFRIDAIVNSYSAR